MSSRSFAAAYLASEERATRFLRDDFRDPERRIERTRGACRPVAPEILGAIEESSPRSPACAAALHTLKSGAAVVVTGQQVGLFGGPLYSYYKAASAVAVARALEAESGVPCVPIFWLQTEDHDFAEIATARVPEGERSLTLALDVAGGHDALPERASVAHRTLGPETAPLLDALDAVLQTLPHGAEAIGKVRAAYAPGRRIADAFRTLLGGLFADDGLLLLDPRQPEIARAAAPLYAEALAKNDAIAAALSERSLALDAAGFDVQVPIRAGSSLLFMHQENERGARFRIPACDTDSFVALVAREPLRFSSSALLRPLLQDRLLPTAAYVGGLGELSYFAELGPLYALFGQMMPLAIPRARFLVVDERARARLSDLGLCAGDLACDDDAWRRLVARIVCAEESTESPGELRARMLGRVTGELDAVGHREPELARPIERTRATLTRAIDRLCTRWERLLLTRSTVTAGKLARLRARLAPDGQPQERMLSLPWALARYGARDWHALVTAAIEPFSAAFKEIG